MSEGSRAKRALTKMIEFYKKLDTRQRLYSNLFFSPLYL